LRYAWVRLQVAGALADPWDQHLGRREPGGGEERARVLRPTGTEAESGGGGGNLAGPSWRTAKGHRVCPDVFSRRADETMRHNEYETSGVRGSCTESTERRILGTGLSTERGVYEMPVSRVREPDRVVRYAVGYRYSGSGTPCVPRCVCVTLVCTHVCMCVLVYSGLRVRL
jgi:hypothetical protein